MRNFIFTANSLAEARDFLASCGEKDYRADQVFKWIYSRNVFELDNMTDLPKSLMTMLKDRAAVLSIGVSQKVVSKKNGTTKYLMKLDDGNCIESVFMAYRNRNTVCVSTQVGCPLGCAFCATGKQGFIRNMTVDEIVGQYLIINRDAIKKTGKPVTNVVLMGMGEPFLNYKNVMKALDILSEPWGAGMSPRRITVSTSGVLTGLDKFTNEKKHYKLSISLHSPFDDKRKKLIPLNKKYSLRRLVETTAGYIKKTGKTVTFQYLLIGGYNDTQPDAVKLADLIRGPSSKVNIIVYNKVPGLPFRKPTKKSIERFTSILTSSGIKATVRRSMGEDIDSGCGQLRQRKTR